MKKLMTLCAACMVASLASAQVYSDNIVGYETMTLEPVGFTLVGVPFTAIGGTGYNIQDIDKTDMTANTSKPDADKIYIWDATIQDYNQFYLYDKATYGWYGTRNFVNGSFQVLYPAGLASGDAFWYISEGTTFTATFKKPY